ncbi:Hpt domain-containing protein [bacterium]|jgi:HPt (histidine-containing phosphotransfer) domain-containing protein|nr:Hpt domain-containing protein [bacterium]
MQHAPISQPSEIQDRLRKRFLERLATRIRKMRRDLAVRDWSAVRIECRQIRESGRKFGFDDLTLLAARAEQLIPNGSMSRAETMPEAKEAVLSLINKIDQILITNFIHKP